MFESGAKLYLPVRKGEGCTSDANFLRVEVSYTLGGMNYFTYKNEPRGYYMHVSPVKRSVTGGVAMEEYSAFSGYKQCILEVSRKSKAKEAEAIHLAERYIQPFIDQVCKKYGLEVINDA